MEDGVQVSVWRLARDPEDNDVVLLRDEAGRRLPIWIGQWEAFAIWMKMDQNHGPLVRRPMTHDLFSTVLERLGASLEKVVVDDYSNRTYYAKLHLRLNGQTVTVDCRPSDGIALALRAGAPIIVAEGVMAAAPCVEEMEEAEEIDPDLME
jgi:hypothetical protein